MKRVLVIGRSKDADITIENADPSISRKHIEITDFNSSLVYIKDLNSTNGTFVKGFRLIPHKLYKVEQTADIRLGNRYLLDLSKQLREFEGAGASKSTNRPPAGGEPRTAGQEEEAQIVGRSNKADIVIIDPEKRISRKHLSITPLGDGHFLIKDLHSGNGTYINGKQLPPEVEAEVSYQDKITLSTDYRFDLANYFPPKHGQHRRKRQQKSEETTIVLEGAKKITINPNKITLGELSKLSKAGFRTVGRSSKNDIVIDHPKVSRQHMKIRRLSSIIYEVIDLGATNKTFLDGEPIPPKKSVKFQSNAHLVLGGAVPFKLADHFEGVAFLPEEEQVEKKGGAIHLHPFPADEALKGEFRELKKVWEEYRKRKKALLSPASEPVLASSTAEVLASAVELWGNFIPGAGPLIVAGGWLVGRWLVSRRRKRLSDSLSFEDMFLETYCCPNCAHSFGFTPWASIRLCTNCNVVYR